MLSDEKQMVVNRTDLNSGRWGSYWKPRYILEKHKVRADIPLWLGLQGVTFTIPK